jgi:hypothetical protein
MRALLSIDVFDLAHPSKSGVVASSRTNLDNSHAQKASFVKEANAYVDSAHFKFPIKSLRAPLMCPQTK